MFATSGRLRSTLCRLASVGTGQPNMGLSSCSDVLERMLALRAPSASNPKRLTQAQIQQFDTDGVILPLRGISESEALDARRCIEATERDQHQSGNSLFLNGHLQACVCMHLCMYVCMYVCICAICNVCTCVCARVFACV